jgi:hypothetical protein
MYDRLPIKHFTARLEKLEKRYARELQRHLSIMESGEAVVDLDKRPRSHDRGGGSTSGQRIHPLRPRMTCDRAFLAPHLFLSVIS